MAEVEAITGPNVIMISGPNGAGKTTAATSLLTGPLQVQHFVNADTVARGLSAFSPESVSIAAGRIMLSRLRELAVERADFAFETTMASRSFAPWIAGLKEKGYQFHLVYLWLPSPEMAVERVRTRVEQGGHGVPVETIRRRYRMGLSNFFRLYRPMADTWAFYDNSRGTTPFLVARSRV